MEIDGKDWTAAEIARLDENGYKRLITRSHVHGDFPDQIEFIEAAWAEREHVKEPKQVKVAVETQAEPKVEATVEEEEDNPYPEWTNDELRDELKDRGLSSSGAKSVLIARLEEDDAK